MRLGLRLGVWALFSWVGMGPANNQAARPGDSSSAAKNVFAMMMSGKGGSSKSPASAGKTQVKRPAASLQQSALPSLTQLQSVDEARAEMVAMGFESRAVERALMLHAHGARIDLAHAVASCISFSADSPSPPATSAHEEIRGPATKTESQPESGENKLGTMHDHKRQCLSAYVSADAPEQPVAAEARVVDVGNAKGGADALASTARTGSGESLCDGRVTPRTLPPRGGGNLCAFLGVADRSVPPYFYLDWHSRSAHFLHTKPENATARIYHKFVCLSSKITCVGTECKEENNTLCIRTNKCDCENLIGCVLMYFFLRKMCLERERARKREPEVERERVRAIARGPKKLRA